MRMTRSEELKTRELQRAVHCRSDESSMLELHDQLPGNGRPASIAHAEEYEWDPIWGVYEEEWYDPSDWFN